MSVVLVRKQPITGLDTRVHLRTAFIASGQSYGSHCLAGALLQQDLAIGRYKVHTLMRKEGRKPVWKRKFLRTMDSRYDLPVAESLLDRQFNPARPNQFWTSDITYIGMQSGWLYLAAVMDLYSCRVVGWAVALHLKTELMAAAMLMALRQRQPGPELLLYSDRGNQYTSSEYSSCCRGMGLSAV